MIIEDVHKGIQKHKQRKRVGRGPGAGQGKTAGKGDKGHSSRSGFAKRLDFEGGQKTMVRRIAKRGFNNKYFSRKVAIVNVGALEKLFESGAIVDAAALASKGVVKGNFEILKVLGNGDLTKKLTVHAHEFSASALTKITSAGGTTERLPQ